MAAWRVSVSLLLLLVLGACGSSAVMMDYNMAGLWSSYRTYDWLPEPRAEDIGPLAGNPKNMASIKDAVDFAMKNRGMRRDEQNPDLLVAYYAGNTNAIDPKVWGYTYSPAENYKDLQGHAHSYKGGTLVIDLVDAKSKELMWRGWSAGVVEAPNHEKTENTIREAVKKIMAEYPPR